MRILTRARGRDDKELVLEFSSWVLERAPEQAVRIFAERSKATADLIPPTTVLELLSKLGSVVIQRYLEFIIHEQGNEEEAYHTQLATAYTDQALQGLASAAAQEVRQKLCDFLRSPACRTDFKASPPPTHPPHTPVCIEACFFATNLVVRWLVHRLTGTPLSEKLWTARSRLYQHRF